MSSALSHTEASSVRAGIVGAGAMAAVHVSAWQEIGTETFVHSRSGSEEFAATTGSTSLPSMEELLGRVDIVDVCTPTPRGLFRTSFCRTLER